MNNREYLSLVAFVAAFLSDAGDEPRTIDQIVPKSFSAPGGVKKVTSKYRDLLIGGFLRNGLLRRSGNKFVVGNRQEIEKVVKEWSEAESQHEEIESHKMKMKRYNYAKEEQIGRSIVAVRAVTNLLSSKKPKTAKEIFDYKRGDKFQERACFNESWWKVYLNELVRYGVIKEVVIEGKVHYEVDNVEYATTISKGITEPCVFTLISPSLPCQENHGSDSGIPFVKMVVPDREEEVSETEAPAEVIEKANSEIPPESKKFEGLFVTDDKFQQLVDVCHSQLKINKENSDLLTKVCSIVIDSTEAMNSFNTRIGKMENKLSDLANDKSSQKAISKAAVELSDLSTSINSGFREKIDSLQTEIRGLRSDFSDSVAKVSRAKKAQELFVKLESTCKNLDDLQEVLLESAVKS